jgi:hypothetical protein
MAIGCCGGGPTNGRTLGKIGPLELGKVLRTITHRLYIHPTQLSLGNYHTLLTYTISRFCIFHCSNLGTLIKASYTSSLRGLETTCSAPYQHRSNWHIASTLNLGYIAMVSYPGQIELQICTLSQYIMNATSVGVPRTNNSTDYTSTLILAHEPDASVILDEVH